MSSVLKETIKRMQNAEKQALQRIRVRDSVMNRLLQSAYRIIRELDKEVAGEGRRVVYTLIRRITSCIHPDFSDPELSGLIREELNEVSRVLSQFTLPDGCVKDFSDQVDSLIDRGTNWKFVAMEEQILLSPHSSELGIVDRGIRWRTFDLDPASRLSDLTENIVDFTCNSIPCLNVIYTPIPLGKMKRRLATDILMRGGASTIVTILYEGEFDHRFEVMDFVGDDNGKVPKLIEMGDLPEILFDQERVALAEELFIEPDDSPQHQNGSGLIQVLVESERTVVLPVDDEIWAIRDGLNQFSEVWPDLLDEDDCLVFVPDVYVESPEEILLTTQVWRGALNVLLLSMSYKEVAELIVCKDLPQPSPGSVKSWSEGEVYGPDKREIFFGLIDVLVQEMAIDRAIAESSRDEWWSYLEKVRKDQVSKGMESRRALIKEIRGAIDSKALSDVHGISIERVLAVQQVDPDSRHELGRLSGSTLRVMQ